MFAGQSITLTRLEGPIAHLCFDRQGAGVNTLNRATLGELQDVLSLLQDTALEGLVISSAKRGFIAGADISEFAALFSGAEAALGAWCRESNAVLTAFESLPFPTVSLLQGHALGGGLEFALCTDYRIATLDAVLGFPETGLGICPGFGGTVRAPRVMDPVAALTWATTGNPQSATLALAAGALDQIVDATMLQEAALEMLAEALRHPDDWIAQRRRKAGPVELNEAAWQQAVEASRKNAGKGPARHNPAPLRVLEMMEHSVRETAEVALVQEQALFVSLARNETARNLIGIFTNEQWLRQKSRRLVSNAAELGTLAVLGAGIMGGGIAYQSASRGVPVIMKDIAQAGLDAGMAEADKQLSKQVERGKLTATQAHQALTSISPRLDYDGFSQADAVIEAVVENSGVKQRVLAEVESHVSQAAVIMSNTSTISISVLANALKHPERFCGMHFFNPVPVMPLVEVIRGDKSSDQAIASTVALAQRLGKTPIVVNDCPGFLVNRILFPYFGAFSMLLRDGADFHQIDAVMEAYGWPMGPAYLLDVVGMDTAVHAQAVMADGFPDRMRYGFRSAMDVLFEAGRLGQKSGRGFYRYEKSPEGRLLKQRDDASTALLKAHVAPARVFEESEIIDRLMLALCFEAVRCLEDGIVETPIEVDMGLVLGLGFPRFRGGALRTLDNGGAETICRRAEDFAALGPLYTPPQSLRDMAAAGGTFYGQSPRSY